MKIKKKAMKSLNPWNSINDNFLIVIVRMEHTYGTCMRTF